MQQGPVAQGQVSPDGQFMWDGAAWQPITGSAWEPTEWTRPMQMAVAAYWLVAGLFAILSPLLLGQAIKDAALKSIQQQNSQLTPDQQQQALNLGLTIAFAFSVTFGLIYLALAVLSFVRRFSWVFYVDLVLLGLSSIGVVTNLSSLSSRTQAPFIAGIGLLLSLAALVLFVWMLIARIRRGVWACRKAPVVAGATP